MARNSPKAFVVEVKRHARKRSARTADAAVENAEADSTIPGQAIRFREAETMFRAGFSEPDAVPMIVAQAFEAAQPEAAKPANRRVLVDLVAEAALAERARQEEPVRRGRGRPRKTADEALPPLPKSKRTFAMPDLGAFAENEEVVTYAPPVLIDLAASRRRRAARSTDNLPRSERWKRRLPKACW